VVAILRLFMYINCLDDLANRVEDQGSNEDVSSLLLAVSLEFFQSSNTLSKSRI
jgi:hypothetical protein